MSERGQAQAGLSVKVLESWDFWNSCSLRLAVPGAVRWEWWVRWKVRVTGSRSPKGGCGFARHVVAGRKGGVLSHPNQAWERERGGGGGQYCKGEEVLLKENRVAKALTLAAEPGCTKP